MVYLIGPGVVITSITFLWLKKRQLMVQGLASHSKHFLEEFPKLKILYFLHEMVFFAILWYSTPNKVLLIWNANTGLEGHSEALTKKIIRKLDGFIYIRDTSGMDICVIATHHHPCSHCFSVFTWFPANRHLAHIN
jgi:hypothetical protein